MAIALSPADLQGAQALPGATSGPLRLSADDLAGAQPFDAQAAERPKKSWFESLVRGAAQGATFGFADELTGAAESLFSDKTYQQARDESRREYHQAEEDHPVVSTIGQVGGGLATALLPAGAIVKGGGLAAHALRGAGAGILSGLGTSEATDAEGVVKDAARSGLTGAVVGGALGAAGEKLVKGAPARADQRLLGELGNRANKSVRDKMADFAPKTLETAREFGLDKLSTAPEKLLEGASAARKEVGQQIGQIYEDADRVFMGVKAKDVAAALAATKKKYSAPTDAPIRRQIDSLIEEVKSSWGKRPKLPSLEGETVTSEAGRESTLASKYQPRVPLAKVNEMVTKLENQGFASADLTPSAGAQLKRNLAGAVDKVLKNRMDEIREFAGHVKATPTATASAPLADSVSAAAGLDQLGKLNANYRALKLLEKSAGQRARLEPFPPNGIRQIAGSGLDTGSLIASLATGSPLPYVATKVGIPAARAGAKVADIALAKLYSAAQSGQVTAQLVQQAIEAGVPRGLVERFSQSVTAQPQEGAQ